MPLQKAIKKHDLAFKILRSDPTFTLVTMNINSSIDECSLYIIS